MVSKCLYCRVEKDYPPLIQPLWHCSKLCYDRQRMLMKKPGSKDKISRSVRAGLVFPVGRLTRKLRKGNLGMRVGKVAPVYLGAVLEYLTAEILELAGNASKDNKKKRITPRFLTLAIRGDEELDKLFGSATISQGGVIPHIHSLLVKPKKPLLNEKQILAC